jgi:hypothetical protein
MHDQSKAAGNAAEDLRDERAVLLHVVEAFPQTLRLSDLIRDLSDPEDFHERDRLERAVRELIKGGLVFRSGGAVLPTRAATRAYELLVEAA